MTQISPGVFVSDEEFASDLSRLRRYNISHILIVAKGCVAHFPEEGISYLIKAIQDTPDQKIFHMFSSCCEFIEKARRRGRVVLIHCHAGLSRSVTFAAAYLMAKTKCTLQEALDSIKERIPDAQPNPGFISQLQRLEVYLANTLPARKASPAITQETPPGMPTCSSSDHPTANVPISSSSTTSSSSSSTTSTTSSTTTSEPSLSSPSTSTTESSDETNSSIEPSIETGSSSESNVQTTSIPVGSSTSHDLSGSSEGTLIPVVQTQRYRCRQCRFGLFGVEDIIEHADENGYTFTKSRIKLSKDQSRSIHKCNNYFIDQLPWMSAAPMNSLVEVEGKLHCPKCAYRLGSWAWNGAQCSCGYWATPAIQIIKTRIDQPTFGTR